MIVASEYSFKEDGPVSRDEDVLSKESNEAYDDDPSLSGEERVVVT